MDTIEEKFEDVSFEDLVDEENGEESEIPKEERKLITQAYDKSVNDLKSMIDDGDIILNPEYQREYVWDNKKASLLIESILLNVPIPIVYVSEEEEGEWSVIDGLQRLNSISRFLDNEFKLTGLEVLKELNRHSFKDLNPKAKRVIKNGIIRVILIFKESNPEIKYDIFMRLNTGSVKLSEQELRNCLYRGDLNTLLKQLRENDILLKILGLSKPHKRMADAELVLRYFAISENYEWGTHSLKNYPGKMKTFLNQYMSDRHKMSKDDIDSLRQKFTQTINKTYAVFGNKAFRRVYSNGVSDSIINRSIMDSVMLGFERYSKDQLVSKKAEIIGACVDMFNKNVDFINSISLGTSDRKQIQNRIKIFSDQLSAIMA